MKRPSTPAQFVKLFSYHANCTFQLQPCDKQMLRYLFHMAQVQAQVHLMSILKENTPALRDKLIARRLAGEILEGNGRDWSSREQRTNPFAHVKASLEECCLGDCVPVMRTTVIHGSWLHIKTISGNVTTNQVFERTTVGDQDYWKRTL